MSRHPVGMVTASRGVPVGLEVNLKPNQDTEQGLSPTVTQEARRTVPRHLTGEQCAPFYFFTPKESLLLFSLEAHQN